jgi:hypothetical protein
VVVHIASAHPDGLRRVVTVTLAEGYGLAVQAMDEGSEAGPFDVSLGDILAALDEGGWFENLRVRVGDDLAFGMLDSGHVVVEGPRELLADIGRAFPDGRWVDGPTWLTTGSP